MYTDDYDTDVDVYAYDALVRKLDKVIELVKQDHECINMEATYELDDFKKELLHALGWAETMEDLRCTASQLNDEVDDLTSTNLDLEREIHDLRHTIATLKGEPDE